MKILKIDTPTMHWRTMQRDTLDEFVEIMRDWSYTMFPLYTDSKVKALGRHFLNRTERWGELEIPCTPDSDYFQCLLGYFGDAVPEASPPGQAVAVMYYYVRGGNHKLAKNNESELHIMVTAVHPNFRAQGVMGTMLDDLGQAAWEHTKPDVIVGASVNTIVDDWTYTHRENFSAPKPKKSIKGEEKRIYTITKADRDTLVAATPRLANIPVSVTVEDI